MRPKEPMEERREENVKKETGTNNSNTSSSKFTPAPDDSPRQALGKGLRALAFYVMVIAVAAALVLAVGRGCG